MSEIIITSILLFIIIIIKFVVITINDIMHYLIIIFNALAE